MTDRLRIATRRSPLALWQAEHVAARLRAAHPGLEVDLVPMVTEGDRVLDRALAAIGGKGLFIKELEQALLERRADLAVHSMKDVPAVMPEGMVISTVLERADPRDAFVSARFGDVDELPQGAHVGTSSLRRRCQLAARRPDLRITDLRGNVGTRLRRLDDGDYDAILLATAGLERLGLGDRIRARISPTQSLPAVGQGIVGIETLADDRATQRWLAVLEDSASRQCIEAERAFAHGLGASCTAPVAAYATLAGDALTMHGLVGAIDGKTIVRGEIRGAATDAAQLGAALAQRLIDQGAGALLTAQAHG